MKKITRKEFTEILINNKTVLAGSVFRWTDEKCIAGMEKVNAVNEKAERRTVTEKHVNYLVFSNGSRLDFNQSGRKEYFSYKNKSGIQFVIQRTEIFDDFDEEINLIYIIYIVI